MRNARQSDIERGLGMWTTREKQTDDREISRCSAVRTVQYYVHTTRHDTPYRLPVLRTGLDNSPTRPVAKQMRNDSRKKLKKRAEKNEQETIGWKRKV